MFSSDAVASNAAAECCALPVRPPRESLDVRLRSMIAASSASVGGASDAKQQAAPNLSMFIISEDES
eukprot:6485310-Prymnesium_polylepis.1